MSKDTRLSIALTFINRDDCKPYNNVKKCVSRCLVCKFVFKDSTKNTFEKHPTVAASRVDYTLLFLHMQISWLFLSQEILV